MDNSEQQFLMSIQKELPALTKIPKKMTTSVKYSRHPILNKAARLRHEKATKDKESDTELEEHRARLAELSRMQRYPQPISRRRPFSNLLPSTQVVRNETNVSLQPIQSHEPNELDKKLTEDTLIKRPKSVPKRFSPLNSKDAVSGNNSEADMISLDFENETEGSRTISMASKLATIPEISSAKSTSTVSSTELMEENSVGENNTGEMIGDKSESETTEDKELLNKQYTEKAAEAVRLLQSPSEEDQLKGAAMARKDLSVASNPPIQHYIDAGSVPILVKCLSSANDQLVFESAWAITNIVSGNAEQTKVIYDAGAIPLLVALLRHPNADIAEQSVWALGNVIGDGPQMKQAAIDAGIATPMADLITESTKLSYARNLAWAVSCLFRSKPTNISKPELGLLLVKIKILCQSTDQSVIVDTYWALSNITDITNNIDLIIDKGYVPIILKGLEKALKNQDRTLYPLIRTVGNITTGDDKQTQSIVSEGVIPHLISIITNSPTKHKREALWALSNILAGNEQQILTAVDKGCLPAIKKVIDESEELAVLREAAWCIGNLASQTNSTDIVDKAVDLDLPRGLTRIFYRFAQDNRLQVVCIESLANLFNKTSKKGDCYDSMFKDTSADALGDLISVSPNAELYQQGKEFMEVLRMYEEDLNVES